jgi:sugar phosphate permease
VSSAAPPDPTRPDSTEPTSLPARRGRRVFFGWWVVLGAIAVQALQAALLVQAYGAYVPVLQADLGWSATLFASAFSLLQAIGGVLGPFQGRLLMRVSPRALVRFGLALMGLAFLLLSRVGSPAGFFLAFGLTAVGLHLSGFLTLTTIVVNWFERRRSLALALMQLGVPIGGLALPLVAWALAELGWRATAFGSGITILALGMVVAQLLRGRPEDFGLLPDGGAGSGPAPAGVPGMKGIELGPEHRDFTAAEAIRTRAFWFIAGGHALALMIVSAVNVHAVIHINSGLGYTLPAAAAFIALMTTFTLVGQVLGGILGDRYSKRIIACAAMWLHAVALLALTFAASAAMVVLFAAIHGLAWGIRGPLMQALRVDYFGRTAFSTILGNSMFIVTLGALSGPLLAGILYDLTGDYLLGFTILATLAAAGSLFFLLATRPTPLGTRAETPASETGPS